MDRYPLAGESAAAGIARFRRARFTTGSVPYAIFAVIANHAGGISAASPADRQSRYTAVRRTINKIFLQQSGRQKEEQSSQPDRFPGFMLAPPE